MFSYSLRKDLAANCELKELGKMLSRALGKIRLEILSEANGFYNTIRRVPVVRGGQLWLALM